MAQKVWMITGASRGLGEGRRSAGSLLHCFIFEPRNDATTGYRFVVTRWRMTQSDANQSPC